METNQKELDFIKNPDLWPNWPYLPVVSRKGFDKNDGVGLVLATEKSTVFVGVNLFALNELPGKTLADKLQPFLANEYASFEALLVDWRID